MEIVRVIRKVELHKGELRELSLQVLPIIQLPRGTESRLVADLLSWVGDDVQNKLPALYKQALKFTNRRQLTDFLRNDCKVKIPQRIKKDDIALMILDELRKSLDADTRMAADIDSATGLARAADTADAAMDVDVADAAIATQVVVKEPLRQLRKTLKRTWIKGASLIRRKLISNQIRRALAAYTLEDAADSTACVIRSEVAAKVKMSLESGQARAFFERQLSKHVDSLRKPRRSKRIPSPQEVMRKYELEQMKYEDALSEQHS